MALLVEGLDVGGETSIEEYLISRINRDSEHHDIPAGKGKIKLYGPGDGLSWTAKPATGRRSFGFMSQHASTGQSPLGLVDPLVTLLGSAHEKLSEASTHRSTLFPFVSSAVSSLGSHHVRVEELDEESVIIRSEDDESDDSDDNLRTPLISRQTTAEKDMTPTAQESLAGTSPWQTNAGESVGSMGTSFICFHHVQTCKSCTVKWSSMHH